MTVAESPVAAPPARGHDRLLIAVAIVALGISIAMAIAGDVLHIAVPLVLVLVIVAVGIALRIVLGLRARRSPTLSNQRVMNVVSFVGLGLSIIAVLVELAVVLPLTTLGNVLADLALHGVTIAVLLVLTAPARTLGWRALLGTGLASFLGVSALARGVGAPIATAVGVYTSFFTDFYAPFTEEVLKAAPILLVLIPAMRNPRFRPTAVDFALVGLASGTGFAIIENANANRVLTGAPTPLLIVFPSMSTSSDLFSSTSYNAAGHAVWTAFVGLGLGFGLLYRRRLRFAWVAIPVTFALALTEHCVANGGGSPTAVALLTAGGFATPVLLLLGVIALTAFEAGTADPRSLLRNPRELLQLGRDGLVLRRPTVATRAALGASRERAAIRIERAGR